MMQRVMIENTNLWAIVSYGNGLAYSFTRKRDGMSAFLQGDDAAQWREEFCAMGEAFCNPESAWHRKTWNDCLSQICGEYVDQGESLINRAASCPDLDTACRIIQEAIAQTDGGIAGVVFSDLDNPQEWRGLSIETRRNRLLSYLETEFAMAEG